MPRRIIDISVALKAGLTSTQAEEVRQETFIVAFKKMVLSAIVKMTTAKSS